jgi:hypothetical protein
MKSFWIGLSVMLPVLAQTPGGITSRQDEMKRMDLDYAKRVLQFQGGVVKNAPYSADAVTQSTQVLGDGNRIEQSTTQKLYRDSQGRERREETVMATGVLAQAEMPHMVTISDPVDKVTYTLDTEQRTARRNPSMVGVQILLPQLGQLPPSGQLTLPLQFFYANNSSFHAAAASTAGRQIGVGSVLAREDLGSKNIEGVMATGARTTQTIPAGQIGNVAPILVIDEAWFSEELKMNVLTTHSDPRTGETVYKLLNINRTEQPKSLFEPPAGYTVTGPAADAPTRGPAHTPK